MSPEQIQMSIELCEQRITDIEVYYHSQVNTLDQLRNRAIKRIEEYKQEKKYAANRESKIQEINELIRVLKEMQS